MGRGLSDLQRRVLALALKHRQTDAAVGIEQVVDVTRAALLCDVWGWKAPRLRLGTEHGDDAGRWNLLGPHFDVDKIGAAEYASAQASLSRALRRLEERGLGRLVDGAGWAGLCLTDEGALVANGAGRVEATARMARALPTAAEYREQLRVLHAEGHVGAVSDFRYRLQEWSGWPLAPAHFRRDVWAPVREELGLPVNVGYPKRKRTPVPRPSVPLADPPPWPGLGTSRNADTKMRETWRIWMEELVRDSPGLTWKECRLLFARRWRVWLAQRKRFVLGHYNPARKAAGLSLYAGDFTE